MMPEPIAHYPDMALTGLRLGCDLPHVKNDGESLNIATGITDLMGRVGHAVSYKPMSLGAKQNETPHSFYC